MQDAVGTVVDIQFHGQEFGIDGKDDWRHNPDHDAWKRGYVYLNKLPTTVHVRFDNYTVDVGFGLGVVVLGATKCTYAFLSHDKIERGRRPRVVNVTRSQFALAPERIRTAQSAQGVSMGALTAMLDTTHCMDADAWWFHVYVILSRARHIGHLLLYGLPPKWIFEKGPPAWLRVCLREFDLRIRDTEQRAERLLLNFHFFNVYERRSSTAADSGRGVSQEFCLPDELQHQNGKRDFAHTMREREESKGCVASMPSSSGCPDRPLAELPCVEASPQTILNGIVCVAACTVENPGRLGAKKRRSH